MKTLFATTLLSTALSMSAFGTELDKTVDPKPVPTIGVSKAQKKESQESVDRKVDEAAIDLQKKAINTVTKLLNGKSGRKNEPTLLYKLGFYYLEKAELEFRISYGSSNKKKAAEAKRNHKNSLIAGVGALGKLIEKYPLFAELSRAHYMRGKAYQELENSFAAKRDYRIVTTNFKDSLEYIPSHMALAEYAVEEEKHLQAIEHLQEVEKSPNNIHYPFALFKLAWSHYALKNVPTGRSYLEKHISFYNKKRKGQNGLLSGSDDAILENSYVDIALFYFDGFEKKLDGFELKKALNYFEDLGPNSEKLGKMAHRMSKLLRSRDLEVSLIEWKNDFYSAHPKNIYNLDIAMTVFEHLVNKKSYEHLVEAANQFVLLKTTVPKLELTESYSNAQKLLAQTAEKLRTKIIRISKKSDTKNLTASLSGLYLAFTQFVPGDDPRIPGAYYNLAETQFKIESFDSATKNYLWVVENFGKFKQGEISLQEVRLKALSSRYQSLRAEKVIPTSVATKKLSDDDDSKLDEKIETWISWIDDFADSYPKSIGEIENFEFEANRTIYSKDRIIRSIKRFVRFSKSNTNSKFAIPSAALVIDTFIASEDWKKAFVFSSFLREKRNWKNKEFNNRLFTVESDSAFKLIEFKYSENHFESVIKECIKFSKTYEKSPRSSDCLFLASKSALALKRDDTANQLLSSLIKSHPKSKHVFASRIQRANILERQFKLTEAALDYLDYLSAPNQGITESDLQAVRLRALNVGWNSGDRALLGKILSNQGICSSKNSLICSRYQALLSATSQDSLDPASTKRQLQLAMSSNSSVKAIWALSSLRGAKHLSYPDRLVALKIIGGNWSDINAEDRISAVPALIQRVPVAFELNRGDLLSKIKLHATEKSIERRIKKIEEMETVGTKLVGLPWKGVQGPILKNIAGLYFDFENGLKKLTVSKDASPEEIDEFKTVLGKIIAPFHLKGKKIENEAFELAALAPLSSKATQSFAQFQLIKKPEVHLKDRSGFSLDDLAQLTSRSDWYRLVRNKYDPADDRIEFMLSSWIKAVTSTNWPKANFFLREIEQSKKTLPADIAAMKTYTLSQMGSIPEALYELESRLNQFEDEKKTSLMLIVLKNHSPNFQKTRIADIVKKIIDIAKEQERHAVDTIAKRDDLYMLAVSAIWSESDLDKETIGGLLHEMSIKGTADQKRWAQKNLSRLSPQREIAQSKDN